ncbi:hypothetical protein Sipo8835_00125 [Streptomyces ipomoeae]|uniref:Uncharacterized protein n=1 Tax=Streptomyces ipomoeae TaxID=103232 RepID=A0AAE9B2Y9_9ACTN|nr:hypothetical protein [Streptomyces ipomoeae]TQE40252.1 hypothetical protein Sipo8835_00125 [Streptomyces ipomoeae]
MAARFPIPRPTESAAIAAAGRSARRLPPVHTILADLVAAHRAGDQHGVNLCAHLAVRAAAPEVGE